MGLGDEVLAAVLGTDTGSVAEKRRQRQSPQAPTGPPPSQFQGGHSTVDGTVTANQGNAGATAWPVDTELPAAAAVGDTSPAAPVAPVVESYLSALYRSGTGRDRVMQSDSNSDAVPTQIRGQLMTAAQLYGFNGTTWDRLRSTTAAGLKVDGSAVTQPISAASLPLPSGAATEATLAGVIRAEDSAASSGQNGIPALAVRRNFSSIDTSADGDYATLTTDRYNQIYVNNRSFPLAAYSAGILGLNVAASPTDVFTIKGTANTIVSVTGIRVSGICTTGAVGDIQILKRSTADTGGTSTTPTVVPHDSTSSAGSAVVNAYTANPTLGTLVGILRANKITLPTAAANAAGFPGVEYKFGERTKPPILRGSSEQLCLNLNGVTITGESLDISITWTEEPDT